MEHVAHMGERKCIFRVLVGKPLGKRRHRRKIILKWALRKSVGRVWTGLIWLGIGTGGGPSLIW